MTVIPVGYGQCTLLFTGNAVPTGAAVTFGFLNTNNASALNCAVDLKASVATSDLLNRMTSNIVLSTTRVKLGPVSTGPMAEDSGTDAGDAVGDSNPAVALLVQKTTAIGGRKGRGRMYWPGIIEADIAMGGALTSTALTEWATAFSSWLVTLEAIDLPMFLLHNDPAIPPTVVTGLSVSPTAATQRRRLRR